jgi:hypothetical protein
VHEVVNNLQRERGQSQIREARDLLVPDPLTLYPQGAMIKGLPYLVAGPDQAHLDTRVWFPMEMLVPIQGLGRYYAGTEGFGFLWSSSQVQTGAEIS